MFLQMSHGVWLHCNWCSLYTWQKKSVSVWNKAEMLVKNWSMYSYFFHSILQKVQFSEETAALITVLSILTAWQRLFAVHSAYLRGRCCVPSISISTAWILIVWETATYGNDVLSILLDFICFPHLICSLLFMYIIVPQ